MSTILVCKSQISPMYSHTSLIKLILIVHKAVAMKTDNTSNVDIATKKLQMLKCGRGRKVFL